jgi:hypothetical protein
MCGHARLFQFSIISPNACRPPRDDEPRTVSHPVRFAHAGNDFTVGAPADHQAGMIVTIFFKVTNCGKELLMPDTEQNFASLFYMITPSFFVLNGQPKRAE